MIYHTTLISIFIACTLFVYFIGVAVYKSKSAPLVHVFSFFLLITIAWTLDYSVSMSATFPDIDLYENYIRGLNDVVDGSASMYANVLAPVFWVAGNSVWVFLVIQSACIAVSGVFLGAAANNIDGKKYFSVSMITSVMMVLSPSVLVFGLSPLREYAAILSASILIYSVTTKHILSAIISSVLAMCLFFVVRPFYTIAAIVVLVIVFFKRYWVVGVVVALIIAPAIFYVVRGHHFSIEWLVAVREMRISQLDDNIYGLPVESGLLQSLLLLYGQFILSPLPILHDRDPFHMSLFFLDMVYVSGMIVMALIAVFQRRRSYWALIVVFAVFTALPALWEAYIGGAVRHRMPAVLALIVINAHWLSRKFKFVAAG